MLQRNVVLLSVSRADDLAFEALEDVARLSAALPNIRVVGGLMVQLLLAAFPTDGTTPRRTVDADAAIAPAVAASGEVHRLLEGYGYSATAGNRYVRDGRTIDLLVPSGHRFGQEVHGGRAFDAVPGLMMAMEAPGIELLVEVVSSDGRLSRCTVTVPGLEAAVVLKALATVTRSRASDLVDLQNLLEVVAAGERDRFGGWRLDGEALTGARGDAAAALHKLARQLRTARVAQAEGVQPQRLAALIRALVRAP